MSYESSRRALSYGLSLIDIGRKLWQWDHFLFDCHFETLTGAWNRFYFWNIDSQSFSSIRATRQLYPANSGYLGLFGEATFVWKTSKMAIFKKFYLPKYWPNLAHLPVCIILPALLCLKTYLKSLAAIFRSYETFKYWLIQNLWDPHFCFFYENMFPQKISTCFFQHI